MTFVSFKIYNLLGCPGSSLFRYTYIYRILMCLQVDVYPTYGSFNACSLTWAGPKSQTQYGCKTIARRQN